MRSSATPFEHMVDQMYYSLIHTIVDGEITQTLLGWTTKLNLLGVNGNLANS